MSKSLKPTPTSWVIILSLSTIAITLILFGIKTSCGQPLISASTLGQFGGFYGGVIATVASIFAGVYLYQTYTNAKKDSDFKIINKLFDNIVHDINSLQFRIQYDKDWKEFPQAEQKVYTGIDAIYNYNSFHHTNPNSVMNHLNSILNSFENIIHMANARVLYKYDDMKEITLKRIYYLYYSHILWSVWELEYPNEKRPNCEKEMLSRFSKQNLHDDSKFIVDKYAKLSIETIKFLSDDNRKLIEKKPDEISKLEKLKM
jgi:hypothetical protein